MKKIIKEIARYLRRNQTKTEAILWQILRNRKLLGKKFLRQHPIIFDWEGKERFFVADFYCHEARLVVELDGLIHEKQKDYDELRDYIMECLEIRVLRFSNSMIENNFNTVLNIIKKELSLFSQERDAEENVSKEKS